MDKGIRGGGSRKLDIFHGRHMCIILKKEWKTVAVTCFEKEKMHFTEGAFRKLIWQNVLSILSKTSNEL